MLRRSKHDIVADVLGELREPKVTTRIMYGANLSYHQVKYYERLLAERGIIQKTNDSKWTLTEKGRKLLELYTAVRKLSAELENLLGY